jgi:putative sigma-54 modulation protein
MEMIVSGRHIQITVPIREYIEKRAARLPRYYDRIRSIEAIADKSDSHAYAVEMIVHIDRHDPFLATCADDDLYAAVDQVVDKLERQLTDHKEKLRNRKHTASG